MTLHALLTGWLIVSIGFALLFAPQTRPPRRWGFDTMAAGASPGQAIRNSMGGRND